MYTMSYNYIYADIDECSMDNGGCFHICDNFIGSYRCLCHPGYELLEDQKNCTGMPVRCKERIMLPRSQEIVAEKAELLAGGVCMETIMLKFTVPIALLCQLYCV